MFRPNIIIAEKNPVTRFRMARALVEIEIPVHTTGSVAHLMQELLRNRTAIVVLGNGLNEGMSLTALVRLLKSCSPQTTIILVTDAVSPVEERSMRQQGIFYQASRPVNALGWDELQLAVACACNRSMPAVMSGQTH